MKNTTSLAAVDAGSLSLKMSMSDMGSIQHHQVAHFGDPLPAFEQLLAASNVDPKSSALLLSGQYAGLLANTHQLPVIPPVSALIHRTAKRAGEKNLIIVDIGSSRLAMVEIRQGKLHRYETNSLCAAGTGAFLDQQMQRLGLNYQTIRSIPILEDPPSIASRCSVFAKSDLIHRQQEGYMIGELWNGLAKGLAQAACANLFRGEPPAGEVWLIGGLAKNRVFVHYFKSLLKGICVKLPDHPDFFLSDALLGYLSSGEALNPGSNPLPQEPQSIVSEPPLRFLHQDASMFEKQIDAWENEVEVFDLRNGETLEAYLGADIGSTSTKLALLDRKGEIRLGLYTRTKGNPIDAFQRLLKGIRKVCKNKKIDIHLLGLGTTGSGRKLISHFAGADIVKNEISAHLKGAVKTFPDVQTIFEIGGQDAKYMAVQNGYMKDANMNYVCAAGTGSFLEEQAANLGIPLDQIPNECKGVDPPVSSHRCTVFMEQDAKQMLRKGHSRGQVMAAVIYAVCKNYLHRVVQNRPIKEPLLFLGATAKNKGLVEAFEHLLKIKVQTSPYSHLMGAIGVGDMVRETDPQQTNFSGLELADIAISMSESQCNDCSNNCKITNLRKTNGSCIASWGHRCGKEDGTKEKQGLAKHNAVNKLKKAWQIPVLPQTTDSKSVVLPQALHFFSYSLLWQHFFSALHIPFGSLRSPSAMSAGHSGAQFVNECCYPVKRAAEEVSWCLSQRSAAVFLPYHIQDSPNPTTQNSYYCPLSQAFPAIMKNMVELSNSDEGKRFILPVIDLSKNDQFNSRSLYRALNKHFDLSYREVMMAWKKAQYFHQAEKTALKSNKDQWVSGRSGAGKPRFVLIGRAYNLMDDRLNMGLPEAIASYGYEVIPMDVLPVQREHIQPGNQDMYWAYGQQIIVVSEYIRQHHGLYPIFLTNFNCGPDSFLLSVFEEEMKTKPSLILELDEHGGNGGYLTRLEAFFDRALAHFQGTPVSQKTDFIGKPGVNNNSIQEQTVYIPPMHPIGSRLMSAGLRAFGIRSRPLITENAETYALGNSLVRGSECMPAASTIGSFIHQLRKDQNGLEANEQVALFMPCTDGPCRFGQYGRLHKKIIREQQLNATIISPNADNNYGDIQGKLRMHLAKALMVSDALTKLGCRLRPYETEKGSVDRLIEAFVDRLEIIFEDHKGAITATLKELNHALPVFHLASMNKPLAGIVGEIYVRNSPFANASLIKQIEAMGGEAWVAPMMEWFHYTASYQQNGSVISFLKNKVSHAWLNYKENQYLNLFGDLLVDRKEPSISSVKKTGAKYMPPIIEGEAILSVGRAVLFMKNGASFVINVAPFGCMPGSISASLLKKASAAHGVPVVSIFYDGETDYSELLQAYIQNSRDQD